MSRATDTIDFLIGWFVVMSFIALSILIVLGLWKIWEVVRV